LRELSTQVALHREHQEKRSRCRRSHKPFVAGSPPSGSGDYGSGSSAPRRDPALVPGTSGNSSRSTGERGGTPGSVRRADGPGTHRSC